MTGVTHIFTINSLSLAVLFGGLDKVESHASFRAYCAFSVLLMFCYVRTARPPAGTGPSPPPHFARGRSPEALARARGR